MPRTTKKPPALVELGNRVKARREELGISQVTLSNEIGLHFTFISETERGLRNLSMKSLLILAEGLEMDPADLVEGLSWRD